MDFVQKINPNLTSKQLVRSGQITTLVLVVAACAWAPQIERFPSLFEYLQLVLSFIAPPIAAAFIYGLFSRTANGTGAFVSLLVGATITVIYLVVLFTQPEVAEGTLPEPNWFLDMHFLHRTFYLFVLCYIVNVLVSNATGAKGYYGIDRVAPAADRVAGAPMASKMGTDPTIIDDATAVEQEIADGVDRVAPFYTHAQKIANYTWSPRLIAEETRELADLPWYKNYRYLSVILLAITAVLVIYFW